MVAEPAVKLDRSAVLVAVSVVIGGLAVIFDSTIISLALHTLADTLAVPVSTIQWVSTGYLLALGVAIPVVGWAQACIGGKRLWLIALAAFGLVSIACSLAWDAPSLIAFRVAQGLAGGLMMPLMATLAMQQVVGGEGFGRLMAMVSLPAALGPILAPTLGGLILHWLDWRWLFWVNVPFCVAGLVMAARFIPADPVPERRPRLDWAGLLLVSPGLVGVLYGLSNIASDGGATRADVWLPVLAGLALLAAFAIAQLRRPDAALVDLQLLRQRPVAASSVVLFLSGAALYGSMLLLPLFFQIVRGADVLSAGLLLIPQGLGALASRALAGRLTDTVGARVVAMCGFAVLGLATIPFAVADAGTSTWWLMLVLLVRGFGSGAVMIPVMSVAFVGLQRADVPHASIITRLAQQLGGAFGTALLAVILDAAATGATTVAGYALAFDTAFWWAVGFTAVAVLVSLVLPTAAVPMVSRDAAPAPR